MEKVILNTELRTGVGKRFAKDLRKKDIVPANVYKGGKGAVSLQVTSDDLTGVLHTKAGENVIITLKIQGDKTDKTVVIKEIQRDPVKDYILHIDFNEISLTDVLKVNVPLASKGEPVGVKVDGGVLDHVMWELQIECLPTAIPEKIEVDISNLKIGEAIHVKDIAAPEGVKVLNDPELIAFIVKSAKAEASKEEVVEGASTEPELIRKKKEEGAPAEEEGAAKEAEKPAKEGK